MVVSVVSVGTVTSATGTSVSITTPAGSSGDLVVFFTNHDDYSDGALAPVSPPITLTPIHDGSPQLGDDSRQSIYWAIETQAGGRSFSFGTLTASEECKGVAIRFTGHDSSNPIESGSVGDCAGFRFRGGVDADRIGDLFVGYVGCDASLSSPSAPSGWVERVNSSSTSNSMYIATRLLDQFDYPFPYLLDELTMGGASTTAGDAHGYTFTIAKDTSESYALSGVTKDKDGSALGSCEVAVFREVGGTPPEYRFVGCTTSNAGTGVYSFTVYEDVSNFMVYAIKDDSPHVFDATDNVLEPE